MTPFPPPYRCNPLFFMIGAYDALRQFAVELLSGGAAKRAKAEAEAKKSKTSKWSLPGFVLGIPLIFGVAALLLYCFVNVGMPLAESADPQTTTDTLLAAELLVVSAVVVGYGGKKGWALMKSARAGVKALCYRGFELRYGLREPYCLAENA